MALLERQIVFKRKDGNGNTYMEFPVTKAECVDGAVLTVNNVAPDMNGNVAITSVTKATQDGSGNNIVNTYATKSELSEKASLSHSHAISEVTNLQTTLDAKAPLASPTFTGTPKAPTASAGTNTTQIATTAFVTTAIANKTSVASATKATQDASGNVITSTYATKTEVANAVANLVDSAPDTLNTLGELATALQENDEVTDALNSAIGKKANDADVVKLSGNQTIAGTKTFSSTISGSISGNAGTATKATQDGSGNVITTTYLTKTDASSTYLGKTAKASSATVADSANAVAWGNVSGKPSSYTPSSHNQASSTINALTGYSKPSSTSALVASDTLNSALGKLEKALDSKLGTSDTAVKATSDASGNNIVNTYATKTALTNGLAGKSDSDHTHGVATTSASGYMSASDKSKLDGIAAGANAYTLPTAGSTLGGVKTTSTVTSTSGLTACPIISGVPYYKASSVTLSDLGVTATTTELNYVDGVTSNIQTQLNAKADSSHTHSYLPLSGGNMTGSITFGSDKGVGIKWGTRTNNGSVEQNPYMGYCTNSGDGTFVVGSLLGTTYQNGLAIGGSSGNLLWKGAKILDGNNFSEFALSKSGTAAKATADASGNNIVNTYATKVALNGKMNGSIHTVSERTRGSSEETYGLS